MALVTAYLTRTAHQPAGHNLAATAQTLFERIAAVLRATREVLAEAQEMRRVMLRKYPLLDV